jgi:nitroreductase
MELYDVMRTTFAAREFTDAPLPDTTLFRILENARFAPSGGTPGVVGIIVRDRTTREALAALTAPAAKRYVAQQQAGESPWNSVNPTQVDEATVARTPVPARLTEPVLHAAVVLVVCVDLQVVASTDQYLDRVGVISGASIYPFAWNILLAARHEGYGGTLTTLAVAQEPKLQELLVCQPTWPCARDAAWQTRHPAHQARRRAVPALPCMHAGAPRWTPMTAPRRRPHE